MVEADRPRRVEWEGDGPAGSSARVVYELEPDGSSATPLSLLTTSSSSPAAGSAASPGARSAPRPPKREAERSLENLKRLIEG